MANTVKGRNPKDLQEINEGVGLYAVVRGVRGYNKERENRELVFTWPHLFMREVVMMLAVTVGIVMMAIMFQAPLEELANPSISPNPAKAPWYFLNLQEVLHYFPPNWAGVFLPGVLLVSLMAIPYIDTNPSLRVEDRPFAISLWNFFCSLMAVLTYIGTFFRGPGWEWTWPWRDGMFTVF